jgi:hypothetical protein
MSAIMDPTGQSQRQRGSAFRLAPRPATLAGARLGLLENGKQNARLFLEELGAALRERYGAEPVELRRKPIFSQPVPPELAAELGARCDLVITGVGDCGSCSAAAVGDGIVFERHGTPAAVICTEAFTATADAMAEVQGAPGYRYLVTPHPVAGLTSAQVRERAQALAAEVAALLTAEATGAQAAQGPGAQPIATLATGRSG